MLLAVLVVVRALLLGLYVSRCLMVGLVYG